MMRAVRWRPSKKHIFIVVAIIFALMIGIGVWRLAQRDYGCDWTGFGKCITSVGAGHDLRHEKTLWDWLQFVGPLAIAASIAWYSTRTNRREREISQDNVREAAFQSYLSQIGTLI